MVSYLLLSVCSLEENKVRLSKVLKGRMPVPKELKAEIDAAVR
jgi:hypothetical protein